MIGRAPVCCGLDAGVSSFAWLGAPSETSAALAARFGPRARAGTFQTASIPGTGGAIKVRPEDFVVEEIPAYPPSGEGEHLALLIEKRGLATLQMATIVARHFRVGQNSVGYAGLKDKHAITRQWVTVHMPGAFKRGEPLPPLNHPKLRVLEQTWHGNKLRRGHLRGNRFEIRVRRLSLDAEAAAARAQAVLQRLATTGIANRFGEQRFGHAQNNHLIGQAMIAGQADAGVRELLLAPTDARPEHVPIRQLVVQGKFAEAAALLPDGAESEIKVLRGLAMGRTPAGALRSLSYVARSFYLSSFQSAVFNAVLDARLADGTWNRLLAGDLACKLANGAVFAVDEATLADPETAQRLAAQEIAPTGPMWGLLMPTTSGAVLQMELDALGAADLGPQSFEAFRREWGEELKGDRRPLRVSVGVPRVEAGRDDLGEFVLCRFELPAGSFATVVMDEVMKVAAPEGGARSAAGTPA